MWWDLYTRFSRELRQQPNQLQSKVQVTFKNESEFISTHSNCIKTAN